MYVCVIYIYDVTLAVYRILIGHLSYAHDWLSIYTIYTTADAWAYRHTLQYTQACTFWVWLFQDFATIEIPLTISTQKEAI